MKKVILSVVIFIVFCLSACKSVNMDAQNINVVPVTELKEPEKYILIMDKVDVEELIQSIEEAEKATENVQSEIQVEKEKQQTEFSSFVTFTVFVFVIALLASTIFSSLVRYFKDKKSR